MNNMDESFQMVYWLSYIMPILKDGDILNFAYLTIKRWTAYPDKGNDT